MGFFDATKIILRGKSLSPPALLQYLIYPDMAQKERKKKGQGDGKMGK